MTFFVPSTKLCGWEKQARATRSSPNKDQAARNGAHR
jgi:hypothetical protein